MSIKTQNFVVGIVPQFVKKVVEDYTNHVLAYRHENKWAQNWKKYRTSFMLDLEQHCLACICSINSKKLTLNSSLNEIKKAMCYACFGGIAFLNADFLSASWRSWGDTYIDMISITSYLLSQENWCYLRGAFPSLLTFDDDFLHQRASAFQEYLRSITGNIILLTRKNGYKSSTKCCFLI